MKPHIILLAALCISCSNSAKFEVLNQSNISVDSVTISNGADLLNLKQIRPGQSQISTLKFSTDTNGDGNYQTEVWIKKHACVQNSVITAMVYLMAQNMLFQLKKTQLLLMKNFSF